MENYRHAFLDFAVKQNALQFGEYTLKSGRTSPYFFNSGAFHSGQALARLGRFYAQAIIETGIKFDAVFGPAYKGIPLAASTAIALAEQHGKNVPYIYNRKETKIHGEGGNLVGGELTGRILIIDDVITAGTAIREILNIINQHPDTEAVGLVISLDRQERGKGNLSAIQELQNEYKLVVSAIADSQDLLQYMQAQPDLARYIPAVEAYRLNYGVKPDTIS